MTPLPFPAVLFIEPTNACNFRCPICPESLPDYRERAGYGQRMTDNVFRSTIDSLAGRHLQAIRFWGMGEPLLNPALPAMIRSLRGYADNLELATNGTMIPYYGDPLLDSGLTLLRISVYGSSGNYREKSGSRFTGETVVYATRNARQCRDSMGSTPKIVAQFVGEPTDIPWFIQNFSGVADELSIDKIHNWDGSDARLVQLGPSATTECCPKPFRELYVKANGDVSVCCLDWDGRLIVGNVLKNSLQEIWEDVAINRIRLLHYGDRRDALEACRDCNFTTRSPQGVPL